MWQLLIIFFIALYFSSLLIILFSAKDLGSIYKNKLNLNLFERYRLNFLTKTIKDDIKNDSYIEEIVKLYLRVFRKLPKYKQLNNKYSIPLMQYCMYTLDNWYSLSSYFSYTFKNIKKILPKEIIALIEQEANSIKELSKEEEKKLFTHDSSRCHRIYERIIHTSDKKKPELLYEKIVQLASFNRDIRLVDARSIYHKGYIFMVDKHKESSLKLYLQYLNVKSPANTFRHKAISFRIMARLFSNEKQKKQFKNICEQLEKDDDIEKALNAVGELYTIKRKKIELNVEAIQDANIKQNNVARLLSEYLKDEEVYDNKPIPEINIISENKDSMESYQKELFDLFISNVFRLNQQEVHIFAQSKGLFKDQFIESINDQYYEILDDLLIEEKGEEYILNETYYKEVIR